MSKRDTKKWYEMKVDFHILLNTWAQYVSRLLFNRLTTSITGCAINNGNKNLKWKWISNLKLISLFSFKFSKIAHKDPKRALNYALFFALCGSGLK